MALRHHLRPEQDYPVSLPEAAQQSRELLRPLDGVGVEPDQLQLGHLCGELALEPLGPRPDPRELDRAAHRTFVGRRLRVSAVVAAQHPVAVQHEGHVAVGAAECRAAGAAVQRGRDPAAVQEQDRLAPVLGDRPELGEKRRRERVAGLAPEVDEPHGRQAAAEALAQLEPLEALPALRPRRRAPVDGHRAFERGALGGDRARVVAGIGLLLVRGIVLLVHADEAEPAHRREDRRPRTDHDPRVTAGDPLPLVAALGVGQARMQERDRVAEPCAEAADGLRRKRDLRHEHDRAQPALERGRRGLEVDLRLAASGRSVEQEVAAAPVESAARSARAQPPGRGSGSRERPRPRATDAQQASSAPFTPPPHGRDQLQRTSGRRAVVVRQPQREIDERGRQLVDDGLDRERLHPDRRSAHDVDDDPAGARPAERHRHDRALLRPVGQLVRELARAQRARGHQRNDRPESRHGSEARRRPRRADCEPLGEVVQPDSVAMKTESQRAGDIPVKWACSSFPGGCAWPEKALAPPRLHPRVVVTRSSARREPSEGKRDSHSKRPLRCVERLLDRLDHLSNVPEQEEQHPSHGCEKGLDALADFWTRPIGSPIKIVIPAAAEQEDLRPFDTVRLTSQKPLPAP